MKKNKALGVILVLLILAAGGIESARAEVFIYFDGSAEPCYSAEFGYLRYSIKFDPEDFGVKGNFSITSIFASARIPEEIAVPLAVSDLPPQSAPDSARYEDRVHFSAAAWDTFAVDPPVELGTAFWVTFSYPAQFVPFDLREPDDWDPERNMVETSLGWGPITCDLAVGVAVETPVGIGTRPVTIPRVCTLDQNHPNPFNPSTTISYTTGQAGDVDLTVYDVRGRWVATLVHGPVGAGRHTVVWRGGPAAPSGIYVYQLEFGGTVLRRKMFLSK